jgi:YggT family protein
MGVLAATSVLADAETSLQSFVRVFAWIYVLMILAWVILSWVRLPYSRVTATVQEFLDDIVRPYLRLFRWLPRLGPLDLSPMVAVFALLLGAEVVNALIGAVL